MGGGVLREKSFGGMVKKAVRGRAFGETWKRLGGKEKKVVVGKMKKLV